jgi:hypothetical protein
MVGWSMRGMTAAGCAEDVEHGPEAIGYDQRAPLTQPRRGLRLRDVRVDGIRAVAKNGLGAVQGGGQIRAGKGKTRIGRLVTMRA